MLTGKFSIRKDNRILTFTKFDDIPKTFSHVISFEPDYPPEPHTEEQHNLISKFNDYLKELMTRASSN